ncbi:MAG: two-component system, OmpR family, sensor histidine kinase CpxA [Abditibacteriota bacterium]|nr:two-component system, OmpR family, sensor histidine kinase CpxA [Abditibacteriota bacterium]
MRSLFFKIFLCFWLSHLIVVALTFAVLKAAELQRDEEQRRNITNVLPSSMLVQRARTAIALYERDSRGQTGTLTQRQTGGRAAVAAYFDQVEKKSGLRAVLFDQNGNELSGRAVPSKAAELLKRAMRSGEVEFASSREGLTGARRVRAPSGSIFVLVGQMPRMRPAASSTPPLLGRRQTRELARLFAVFVAAGIVAYGLARYLTAPTVKLRQATRQLASGDLSTRVGSQMGKRRDELADLGRDFDLMAERIQSLLMAERRLLGDISHELRSPLARLQVALELASQSADTDTRTYLDRIELESGRLNGLIGQLLILTRLESAGAEARREPVDLTYLVAEIASDADFEASGQDRSVRITNLDQCATTGSAELLRSAIENVVRNAVRYTREGTSVEIALLCENIQPPVGPTGTSHGGSSHAAGHNGHTSHGAHQSGAYGASHGAQAVIRVRDYGRGVPEDSLSRLFDPFYRVADARDRQSGGVGLGLSIAARAVRFHGGQVTAINAPEGGLLVEIYLPLSSTT